MQCRLSSNGGGGGQSRDSKLVLSGLESIFCTGCLDKHGNLERTENRFRFPIVDKWHEVYHNKECTAYELSKMWSAFFVS